MRPFLFVFIVLSAAVIAAAHVYFYRRLVKDVTQRPRVRRLAVWSFGALAGAALVSRPLTFYVPDLSGRWFLLPMLVWIGGAMYLFMYLVILDAARWLRSRSGAGPTSPERRTVLARGVATAAVVATGGTTFFGTRSAFAEPQITEVPVRLPGLPRQLEGFTMVHLTDVHVGSIIQERFLDQLVRTANRARPDLVAVTGDLVDGSVARLGRYVARLQGLESRHGTYFVTGNHDHYSGAAEWCAALEGFGWQVLRNRSVRIGDAAASFDLLGVDDFSSARNGGGRYDLAAATAGRDPLRASVLLAHQPRDLPAVAEAGIGLQVSGHTHGGQMFPGTIIGDLAWGRHNEGLAPIGESRSQLFVSRGCGFVGPPLRVGAPPEVVKLILLPA